MRTKRILTKLRRFGVSVAENLLVVAVLAILGAIPVALASTWGWLSPLWVDRLLTAVVTASLIMGMSFGFVLFQNRREKKRRNLRRRKYETQEMGSLDFLRYQQEALADSLELMDQATKEMKRMGSQLARDTRWINLNNKIGGTGQINRAHWLASRAANHIRGSAARTARLIPKLREASRLYHECSLGLLELTKVKDEKERESARVARNQIVDLRQQLKLSIELQESYKQGVIEGSLWSRDLKSSGAEMVQVIDNFVDFLKSSDEAHGVLAQAIELKSQGKPLKRPS